MVLANVTLLNSFSNVIVGAMLEHELFVLSLHLSTPCVFCKREMDLPPEKRARVCLVCKNENAFSDVF